MKISIIEPVGGHGGNEFYDFGLCKYLSRENLDVSLYTSDETVLDLHHKFSFTVHKFYRKIYGNDNKLIRGLRYIKGSFLSLVDSKNNNAKLAHFHIYHFSILELFNIVLFRIFRIDCIATIHDVSSFENYGKKNEDNVSIKTKILMKLCNGLLVHSTLAYDAIVQMKVVDSNFVRLVPHGDTDFLYNDSYLSREQAREQIGYKKNGLLLLFFGQIKSVKGLDVLIKSLSSISAEVNLLVVGKCWKQDLDTYSNMAIQSKVADRITFVNKYINNEDVPNYFFAADIVCLPYKKIYSSGVVLRAMDYGSCVIASDLPPLRSVISDNENGLLFKTEDPEDLARVVNFAAGDANLRKELANNGKKFIDANFSWPTIAKRTKQAYMELI